MVTLISAGTFKLNKLKTKNNQLMYINSDKLKKIGERQ
jgi:hypothetical protein